MNKLSLLLLLCAYLATCDGKDPFKPIEGSIPFMVYYASRYRGLCVGSLVSRMVVLTASVCVVNPLSLVRDTRSVTVVVGSPYRHPRRGIRVPVTKILLPKLAESVGTRAYLIEKSVAVFLLKRKVPDVLTDVALRGISLDWRGEETLILHQECFIPGWHYFYKGDKIFPVIKFHLHRNLRVQFLRIVKMTEWCETLSVKLQKALENMGFRGYYEEDGIVCVRDPNGNSQPCHGMYGTPLICKARQVGIMLAPDAQWTNCTGFSNVIHLLSAKFLRAFMTCVSRLFDPEVPVDWKGMQSSLINEHETYDYIPSMYDKLLGGSSSMEDEELHFAGY